MNTKKQVSEKLMANEEELLNEFHMEELEQRFEMRSWFGEHEQTITIEPAHGDTYVPDGNGNVSEQPWYGAGATWNF